MLDIRFVRENAELVKEACRRRFKPMDEAVDELVAIDAERRKLNAKTKELSDRYGIHYATQRAENVKYLILEAVSDNTDMCDISDIRPGA